MPHQLTSVICDELRNRLAILGKCQGRSGGIGRKLWATLRACRYSRATTGLRGWHSLIAARALAMRGRPLHIRLAL